MLEEEHSNSSWILKDLAGSQGHISEGVANNVVIEFMCYGG